jgi:hypothetical protein
MIRATAARSIHHATTGPPSRHGTPQHHRPHPPATATRSRRFGRAPCTCFHVPRPEFNTLRRASSFIVKSLPRGPPKRPNRRSRSRDPARPRRPRGAPARHYTVRGCVTAASETRRPETESRCPECRLPCPGAAVEPWAWYCRNRILAARHTSHTAHHAAHATSRLLLHAAHLLRVASQRTPPLSIYALSLRLRNALARRR